jgi:hypothetical protein
MSNNPPDVALELTTDEARFLLDNCNSNIVFALNAIQQGELSRPSLEKLIALSEKFKGIRAKLIKAGVSDA